MIIINDVTISAEIPLYPDSLFSDESGEYTDEENQVFRGLDRLDDIIKQHMMVGYCTRDDVENKIHFYANGLCQDTIVKEIFEILKFISVVARAPYAVESFIEGEYSYCIYANDSFTKSDAENLESLMHIKDSALDHVDKLAEDGSPVQAEAKKLMKAMLSLLESAPAKRMLPEIDILEAMEQMREEVHND